MNRNVVIVHNSLKTVLNFRLGYIKKLLEINYNVIVLSPNDSVEAKNKLVEMGCIVPKIDEITKRNLVRVLLRMNYLVILYRKKKSIFICHFLITFLFTYFTLIPFNRRVIVYTEGLGSAVIKFPVITKIIKILHNSVSGIKLYCNSSEYRLLSNGRNSKVTNGIGISLPIYSENIRFLNENCFQLLYVGRLIADKGVFDAISTLSYLLDCGINAHLTLVGDVYENNPSSLTQNEIDSFQVKFGDSICFKGYVTESRIVSRLYSQSHLLLLPSRREGFPVCVMEATAQGCLSVVYDVPGCKDAIADSVNGYLVSKVDPELYARTVKQILLEVNLTEKTFECIRFAHTHFCRDKKDELMINTVTSLFD